MHAGAGAGGYVDVWMLAREVEREREREDTFPNPFSHAAPAAVTLDIRKDMFRKNPACSL